MITMDAFRADAFSAVSLTAAVDKLGYVPQYLGTVPGLFNDTPVRATAVWIEERSNAPALIQTTERAAAPKVRGAEQRTARAFRTRTLGEGSRIMADELQGIRAFGSETEMKTLMSEVARRQQFIKNDMELTKENWRLGVIQGKLLDADGTLIYDWNAEFGQPQAAEVNFDLQNANPASGALRQFCNQVVRHIKRALLGVGGDNVRINAVVGDKFWDALTSHPEVRQTSSTGMPRSNCGAATPGRASSGATSAGRTIVRPTMAMAPIPGRRRSLDSGEVLPRQRRHFPDRLCAGAAL